MKINSSFRYNNEFTLCFSIDSRNLGLELFDQCYTQIYAKSGVGYCLALKYQLLDMVPHDEARCSTEITSDGSSTPLASPTLLPSNWRAVSARLAALKIAIANSSPCFVDEADHIVRSCHFDLLYYLIISGLDRY